VCRSPRELRSGSRPTLQTVGPPPAPADQAAPKPFKPQKPHRRGDPFPPRTWMVTNRSSPGAATMGSILFIENYLRKFSHGAPGRSGDSPDSPISESDDRYVRHPFFTGPKFVAPEKRVQERPRRAANSHSVCVGNLLTAEFASARRLHRRREH
jgi:hypothetical protein